MTATPPEAAHGLWCEAPGTRARLAQVPLGALGEGDVLIDVTHSSLNYKDALAITATAPVLRRFPLICGIDLAGVVRAPGVPGLPAGTCVAVTGCGLGEVHHGGLATLARVPAEWCVQLGDGLDAAHAMAVGTAGITAALALIELEDAGFSPASSQDVPLLVTGATGGVGSLAVAIAAAGGYRVVACTGKRDQDAYLAELGATEVLARERLTGEVPPLGPERFGAAIDVVGGAMLAHVLSSLARRGAVAACGLAGSASLETSLYPFVLRGVSLRGVNSVWPGAERRARAWQLAEQARAKLDTIMQVVPLAECLTRADELLEGAVRGRIVVSCREAS